MTESQGGSRLAAEKEPATKRPRRGGTEVSGKVVARLALYRRTLLRAADTARSSIFSHDIGRICGVTSAQVRRDLMTVGFVGHPVYGYDVAGLLAKLDSFLDNGRGVRMALVGVGNLGRALLSYFNSGTAQMAIVAAFDNAPSRINRTIGGCLSHPIASLPEVLRATRVDVGIIAVPTAAAQHVADLLIAAGVRSLINLASARLQVPKGIFVEDIDLGIAIEKAAFYARAR